MKMKEIAIGPKGVDDRLRPLWIRQCQKGILGIFFFAGFTDYVAILISKHKIIILGHKTFFIIKYQSIKRDLQSFKFCNEK